MYMPTPYLGYVVFNYPLQPACSITQGAPQALVHGGRMLPTRLICITSAQDVKVTPSSICGPAHTATIHEERLHAVGTCRHGWQSRKSPPPPVGVDTRIIRITFLDVTYGW
jgi:hypothetical protein